MISMASASNTRANRRAADFVSRSYVSRTPLTPTFPGRVSDYIRAVAETTDEQAAQLAVEAAGARLAWAERLGGGPGWPGTGRRLPGRGRGAGPLGPLDPGQRFIRDRTNEAAATAAHALDIARQNHDSAAEMLALYAQEAAAACAGDGQLDVSGMRQAGDIDPAAVPGQIARKAHFGLTVALCEASELDAALRHGYRGLELARQAADENDQADFLRLLSEIHLDAGRHGEAWEQLRAAIELASRTGIQMGLIDDLDVDGFLCAAGLRWPTRQPSGRRTPPACAPTG